MIEYRVGTGAGEVEIAVIGQADWRRLVWFSCVELDAEFILWSEQVGNLDSNGAWITLLAIGAPVCEANTRPNLITDGPLEHLRFPHNLVEAFLGPAVQMIR